MTQKFIFRLVTRILIFASLGCAVSAIIWYFFVIRSLDNLSAIMFWCAIAIITTGAVLFGFTSDTDVAPRNRSTGGAIDPGDMVYVKNQRALANTWLVTIISAGCLVLAVSFVLSELS